MYLFDCISGYLLRILLLMGLFGLAAAAASPYKLGPEDEVEIRAIGAPELDDIAYRLDSAGEIRLPMIGAIRAEGLAAADLERVVAEKLGAYLREPRVTVIVVQHAGRPVSILGAVREPGVREMRGSLTLAEAIARAGGLSQDASPRLILTRRADQGEPPLPGAELDATGAFYVARLDARDLLEGRTPALNIPVQAHDVISAVPAEQAYVVGAVRKPGGFPLDGGRSLSTLEALALAGGLAPHAVPREAQVLRRDDSGERVGRAIDLRKIIAGQEPDQLLSPNEVLFIPRSGGKAAAAQLARAALSIGTGAAIWTIVP